MSAVLVAAAVAKAVEAVVEVEAEVAEKSSFSATMGGVILSLGALPEPWKFKNMLKDMSHS